MKKILVLMIFLLIFVPNVCIGGATGYNLGAINQPIDNTDAFKTGRVRDTFTNALRAIDAMNLEGSETGTGSKFFVDANVSSPGAGTSWDTAKATLQEAVDECTPNVGDIIYMAADSDEDINAADALDLNEAGITVYGFGLGEHQPTISLITNAGAEMTISAAGITLYNIRILGAYAGGVTAGLVITADGDGTRILGCEFRETSNTMEQLIMISVAADADELVLVGNRFIGTGSADPTSAVYFAGGSDNTVVEYNTFIGTWSAPVVDVLQAASTGINIIGNDVMNLDATAGKTIQLHSSATGTLAGNRCYANGAGFALVGDAMFVAPDNIAMNTENAEVRNYETMFGAFSGVSGAGQGRSVYADMVLNATAHTNIITDIADAVPQPPAAKSLQDILHKDTSYTYAKSEDSLEALGDGSAAILLDTGTTLPATLAGINTSIASIDATGLAGTCEVNSGGQATATCAALGGFGDDYFNTGWSLLVTLDFDSAGSGAEGDLIDIIDYVSDTGLFTLNVNATATITTGDGIWIKRQDELEFKDDTILGSSGDVLYLDSGTSGDGSGRTMENAYATLTLALDAATESTDKIVASSSHAETISAAYAINDIGLLIQSLGEGMLRATFTFDTSAANANFDVSVANVTFDNFIFTADLADLSSCFDVADGGDGLTIKNSLFTSTGTGTEFLTAIDLTTNADDIRVENCIFLANGTDADAGIGMIAGAVDNLQVIDCIFSGAYDDSCFYSNQTITNAIITGNIFRQDTAGAEAFGVGDAATGLVTGNQLYADDYATMFDFGAMFTINNWGTDAVDQQAIRIPLSAATEEVTAVADGSDLERLEFLQVLAESAMAQVGIDTSTDEVWYVDSTAAIGGSGDTWLTAENTLVLAIGDATTALGAYIFLAPQHAEDMTTVNVNKAGITIWGLGVGENRPKLTFQDAADVLGHTVANVKYKNIIFIAGTEDITSAITLDGSSDGVIFEDCEFRNTTTIEFIDTVTLASGCDNVRFTRCRFINNTAAGGHISSINSTSGICDGMVIDDCYFYGTATTAFIEGDQADTNVRMIGNTIINNSASDYAVKWASNTSFGEFTDNRMYADTVATIADVGGLKCFGNLIVDAIDEGAIPWPISQDTTVVGAAADGSPLERLELIQQMLTGLLSVGSNPLLGTQVTRTKEDIFDGSAGHTLFRIANGRILLTHLSLFVEDGLLNGTNNLVNLRSAPTTGSESDLCGTLDTVNDEEGTIYSITGTRGDALIGVDASSAPAMVTPMIIGIGDIELDSSGDGAITNSVQISSELWYFPLDVGATVSAP